jgi:hypothetical protein
MIIPKKLRYAVVVSVIIVSVLFVPVKCFVVRAQDNSLIFIDIAGNDDVVALSHINSIYDERVNEILKVKGFFLQLADVETSSYGIREYYGITEGIQKRQWKRIRFYNSTDRVFSLAINNNDIRLMQFRDSYISIEVSRYLFAGYLLRKIALKLKI